MRIIFRLTIRCLSISLLLLGCKSQQGLSSENSSETITSNHLRTDSSVQIKPENEIEKAEPIGTNTSFEPTNRGIQRNVQSFIERSEIFSSHFTGFCLFDIGTNQLLVDIDAEKYFLPASNVKTFTLYASLRSFDKMLPGVLFEETSDTLFIQPIGDPTFLNPNFSYQPLLQVLRQTDKVISIEWPETDLSAFGTGWMWDDYGSGYMPELSWMPMYGNVVNFTYKRPNVTSVPPLFNDLVETKRTYNGRSNTVVRSPQYNFFTAEIRYPNWSFEKTVPFRYSKSLAISLLKNEIGKEVHLSKAKNRPMDTLYSQPIDTVLRRMMQESDNFIAEQLLIMAALKNGFTSTDDFREFVVENWFTDIEPIWVDGSGLSRYNLIRPIDNVRLLNKLHAEYGWSRIHNLFAQGGISGTIKDWYPNRSDASNPNLPIQPYIIAKTGTLSNNHCLSGYMQTNSGRLMSFSFMNNNFIAPTSEVKEEMQKLLEAIRDYY